MAAEDRVPSSFRDPSGHLFLRDGVIYRQVNQRYREDYEALMESGLYNALVSADLLVAHEEAQIPPDEPDRAFKIIQPRPVAFVSYPYEWCFGQLQDAALATLEIQRIALEHSMILKDASAYNIQFERCRPLLIDTLSFARYREGQTWDGYRQFCQHFLGPLALMAFTDVRLGQLLRIHIDGVPLELTSRLLPLRTRLKPGLFTHIHLHASSQRRFAGKTNVSRRRKMPKLSLQGLVSNLESTTRSLRWRSSTSEWGRYYEATNYTPGAMRHKSELVAKFMDAIAPTTVWDLGANTGEFSRLAAQRGAQTVAFDIDPLAVEKNYRACKTEEAPPLPLLLDLTNPSPSIGWQNRERMSLGSRGPVDLILALALVHHLAIANNVPLPLIANFMASLCRNLIIEFVPKSDSQVQRLLATREDIFADYNRESFEHAFEERFALDEAHSVAESERVMYRMTRKESSMEASP
jgi:ribosomal protein L11 methylase PrmA